MVRKKKIVTWTEVELKGLLEDEDSCVSWERITKHVALHPFQLQNLNLALNDMLGTNLNFYDPTLKGFALLYQNPKILTSLGGNLSDMHYVHVEIQAEHYLFQPEVGKKLKGIVNKRGVNHLGVLVHKIFNVSIPRPHKDAEWIGEKIPIGQEIKFTVTHLDFNSKLPVIQGTLDAEAYLEGCKLLASTLETRKEQKPVFLVPKTEPVSKKKKKKKKSDENVEEENVTSTDYIDNISDEPKIKKEHKKHKGDISCNETQSESEFCDINDSPKKKKKKKKTNSEIKEEDSVTTTVCTYNIKDESKVKKEHKKHKKNITCNETQSESEFSDKNDLPKKNKKNKKEDKLEQVYSDSSEIDNKAKLKNLVEKMSPEKHNQRKRDNINTFYNETQSESEFSDVNNLSKKKKKKKKPDLEVEEGNSIISGSTYQIKDEFKIKKEGKSKKKSVPSNETQSESEFSNTNDSPKKRKENINKDKSEHVDSDSSDIDNKAKLKDLVEKLCSGKNNLLTSSEKKPKNNNKEQVPLESEFFNGEYQHSESPRKKFKKNHSDPSLLNGESKAELKKYKKNLRESLGLI